MDPVSSEVQPPILTKSGSLIPVVSEQKARFIPTDEILSSMRVAVESKKSIKAIQLNGEAGPVFLNISSLAKRCGMSGLSKLWLYVKAAFGGGIKLEQIRRLAEQNVDKVGSVNLANFISSFSDKKKAQEFVTCMMKAGREALIILKVAGGTEGKEDEYYIHRQKCLRIYKVGSTVGEGSFGSVAKINDIVTQNEFVLKRVHQIRRSDKDALSTLLHEASILSQVRTKHKRRGGKEGALKGLQDSPFVVKCTVSSGDIGCISRFAGENLTEVRERIKDKPLQERIKCLIPALVPVVESLACMHRIGIVHRDIKPENICLGEGQARLIDFGLANEIKNIKKDRLVGTLKYIPNVNGIKVNRRSEAKLADVYALGLSILFTLLPDLEKRFIEGFDNDRKKMINALEVDLIRESLDELININPELGHLVKTMLKIQIQIDLKKAVKMDAVHNELVHIAAGLR